MSTIAMGFKVLGLILVLESWANIIFNEIFIHVGKIGILDELHWCHCRCADVVGKKGCHIYCISWRVSGDNHKSKEEEGEEPKEKTTLTSN